MPPHRGPALSPCPVWSATKTEACCKELSDTLGNNSAVFRAECTKLEGDVRYAVVILHANFHLLPTNLSCQKTPAFNTRHGACGLQAACKQRKRHFICSEVARLHSHLQLFSKSARYNPQILICLVQNWVPHRSNTGFATLDGRHALQTPYVGYRGPHGPAPSPGPVKSATKKEEGRKELSDTLCDNCAVFRARRTKLREGVRYAVIILHANFHLLSRNPSCPQTPAFKTRYGPRGIQAV